MGAHCQFHPWHDSKRPAILDRKPIFWYYAPCFESPPAHNDVPPPGEANFLPILDDPYHGAPDGGRITPVAHQLGLTRTLRRGNTLNRILEILELGTYGVRFQPAFLPLPRSFVLSPIRSANRPLCNGFYPGSISDAGVVPTGPYFGPRKIRHPCQARRGSARCRDDRRDICACESCGGSGRGARLSVSAGR